MPKATASLHKNKNFKPLGKFVDVKESVKIADSFGSLYDVLFIPIAGVAFLFGYTVVFCLMY